MMKRTHYNGTLRKQHVGQTVTLIGWVNKRRNLGSLVFIDLRDTTGIVQVTFNETLSNDVQDVRNEYILQVTGEVVLRKDANPNMLTGEIEVIAKQVTTINKANTTPFVIADHGEANEETRLKYRYLDLRRPSLQHNLKVRHQVQMATRNYLDQLDFTEISTPILARSTPEGARDYLVPSRLYNGKFWALPQSPQIYKQLCMIGGLERYFQIARCFRDEDLRADRQPEFTQIDIEMSFADEDMIFHTVEGLMQAIFKKTIQVDLEDHFVRIPYHECMARFGSDKPDLRFGNEIVNITPIFEQTEFQVFKNAIQQGAKVQALHFTHCADQYSRKAIDKLTDFVKHGFKAKALAYLKMENGELLGSIAKVLSDQEKAEIIKQFQFANNDILFVICDVDKIALPALGALRTRIAKEQSLINENEYRFLWVTDFPMFEYSEEENRYVAAHHPFTAPNAEDLPYLFSDPSRVSSRAYDLVLNGYELCSGSIRIYDEQLQATVFEAIGLTMEEAKRKFGFFLDAFQYGTPPHGGVGIGLERLVMVLCGTDNIRDVVAFPTTNSAIDLMSEAPNYVDQKQLDILGIKIVEKE